MLARSAALRTSVRAAAAPRTAAGPAGLARRWESSSSSSSSSPSSSSSSPSSSPTTKPAENHSIGSTDKAKGSPTAMIAGAFGLCFVGVYAFMMSNPQKAQDVAGRVNRDAESKEHKFRRPTSTS